MLHSGMLFHFLNILEQKRFRFIIIARIALLSIRYPDPLRFIVKKTEVYC